MDVKILEKVYAHINHFEKNQGLKLEVVQPGEIRYTLKITDQHLSSPGVCHGGVVAAMMDAVMGSAALSYALTMGNLVSTVELKVSYFQPVHLNDELIGNGVILFNGKRLISAEGEIKKAGQDKLTAKGIGTFNQYPIEKIDFSEQLKHIVNE